jgi:hypothetical protein
MQRRKLFATGGLFALLAAVAAVWLPMQESQATLPEVLVYKSQYCGCCGGWIEHMEANGFQVVAQNTEEMAAVKERFGVRSEHASCHTAVVDGYVVEGHVPADDVKRLLTERPQVAGIAAPGMPIGSPGMEQGDTKQPYDVVSFGAHGEALFSRH